MTEYSLQQNVNLPLPYTYLHALLQGLANGILDIFKKLPT